MRRDTGAVRQHRPLGMSGSTSGSSSGASPIEGRGLFAADAVPAGTVVIGLGGRLVSSAELDSLIATADADPAAPYVDTLTVDEDLHLVLPSETSVHFVNHSCDPTPVACRPVRDRDSPGP